MGEAFLMQKGEMVEPAPPDPWGDATPYYWEGQENIIWETLIGSGGGTLTKNTDNLYVLSTSGGRGYISNSKVNLTGISILYFEMSYSATKGTDFAGCNFSVNTQKSDDSWVARLAYQAHSVSSVSGTKDIRTLDVSGLSGDYHISIYCYSGTAGSSSATSTTYRVWGE